MVVEITRLSKTAKLPHRGSEQAAGYDLFADIREDICIGPHESVLVPTGIALAIPEGYFGGIYARSGLASKEGLRPANCVGVIDSDYRGQVMVSLHNDTGESRTVTAGTRIAQLVIQPFLNISFEEKEELSETKRGEGGFGSTGQN